MKVIYTGLESSGKSLQLAKKVKSLVYRNSKWFKKTGVCRPIISSMRFSEKFVKFALENNVPISYFRDLNEIIYITEADIIMDEVLKYFDSRNWAILSTDAKHWLTQGAKTGVHLYASSQDFSYVEKTFRLLCNEVYVITKIIGSPRPMKSAPPVKWIWGLCVSRQVNPSTFKGDSVTMQTMGMPMPFLIERADTEIFDTNATVVPSELTPKKLRKQRILYMEGDIIVKEGFKWV